MLKDMIVEPVGFLFVQLSDNSGKVLAILRFQVWEKLVKQNMHADLPDRLPLLVPHDFEQGQVSFKIMRGTIDPDNPFGSQGSGSKVRTNQCFDQTIFAGNELSRQSNAARSRGTDAVELPGQLGRGALCHS